MVPPSGKTTVISWVPARYSQKLYRDLGEDRSGDVREVVEKNAATS